MRISDWSSDVCSSDLRLRPPRVRRRGKPPLRLSSEGGEMSAFHTPNFRGWKVVMLHRENAGLQRLARQLERFGVAAEFAWPKLERLDPEVKAVFFDGDSGYDGLFPWPAGRPPVPLIALMRSVAPGRLEWVLA